MNALTWCERASPVFRNLRSRLSFWVSIRSPSHNSTWTSRITTIHFTQRNEWNFIENLGSQLPRSVIDSIVCPLTILIHFSCRLNPKCKFIVTSNNSKCFYRRLIEAFHSTFPPFHFIPWKTLQWIAVWTMFHPSILMIITFRNFFENIWLTLNLKRDFVADIWNTRLRLAIAVRLETVSSLVRTPR